ncbi:BMP family lipoprotein [Sneathiella sp. HT1-7]|jgi:basic membrane protein A|uniref:BMP family lipoprotein n=1 Tax=Sneathiella sp. HT1-7 TaxID=2887192 RepID=UPI001D1381D1|nr:BMP family ABC transporter substrate-binding protein [Sneathiella sp. HT1-7]MCC3304522.1 BMP family ABC transporter substrate-binding protein [Sneathiella sp. HT1-7]
MMKKIALGLLATAALTVSGLAVADDFKPAIVFDMGGKSDKSFNEAAFNGAEKFKKDAGIDYLEWEVTKVSEREQATERMARKGANIVVAVGFAQAAAVEKAAKAHPDTKFTIIDMVVDLPNVQSVVFREEQGSFLVGMAAAMASKTGKVGFIGGMDIPLIRKFALGYKEGVLYANPKAEVIENMTGTTPAAWNDPTKGSELAKSQFDRGADVVFAAAGGTGLGVLQSAADEKMLAIGVDSNQDHLHPGTMLTSMLKRVDVAVYNAMMSAKDGTWQPGIQVLGLAEDGVGFSVDEWNKGVLTEDMITTMNKAKADIISGKIKVTNYMDK